MLKNCGIKVGVNHTILTKRDNDDIVLSTCGSVGQ